MVAGSEGREETLDGYNGPCPRKVILRTNMPPMKLAPKDFGLPARTLLEQVDSNTIAIVIDRKSRILMADGQKILEKAKKIQTLQPSIAVALKTTAPLCSKTIQFLEAEGIQLILC